MGQAHLAPGHGQAAIDLAVGQNVDRLAFEMSGARDGGYGASLVGKAAVDGEGVLKRAIFERRGHDLDIAPNHAADRALDDQPEIVDAVPPRCHAGALDAGPGLAVERAGDPVPVHAAHVLAGLMCEAAQLTALHGKPQHRVGVALVGKLDDTLFRDVFGDLADIVGGELAGLHLCQLGDRPARARDIEE